MRGRGAGGAAGALVLASGTALAGLGVLALVAGLFEGDPTLGENRPDATAWTLTAVTLVAQAATLLLPARRGGLALLLSATAPWVLAITAPSAVFSVTTLPVIAASFLGGLRVPFRDLRWWAVGGALAVAVGHAAFGATAGRTDAAGLVFEAVLQSLIVVGVPLLPATALAASRDARIAEREKLDALTRERDAQVGEAIARERAGMARELHDIAAHHLSGISVMASAVTRQTASAPEAAHAGALQIREQANAVLDDLRRLVGMLRESTDDGAVKTLDTFPELIDAARRNGADVTLATRASAGDAWTGIGPLSHHAAYRMVQESVANGIRHAPGAPIVVTVDDSTADALTLTVRNDASAAASSPGGGFGIVGMRERAALIGATFEGGPLPGGGWRNRMRIPRDAPSREERTS